MRMRLYVGQMALDQRLFEEAQGEPDLMVRLDTRLPHSLPVGRGTAIFCFGACFHRRAELLGLELIVDGRRHRPTAWRMPRLDLFQLLHHPGAADRGSAEDPELRCYRSGFWATLPIEPQDSPGSLELSLAAGLEGGSELVAPLGRIEIVERPQQRDVVRSGLIAVCMATLDPDLDLFRAQVESLRAQTDTNWICLISDDGSEGECLEAIRRTVAGDDRFSVSQSPGRLGHYRNFERALESVPAEAELVALCDHDDRWYPEKLEVLRGALGSAQLVYSDQRLVDADGRVLRNTLWEGRRNNHTNLASLLIANSITGAATLFRREVAELALPFPDTPGWQFHDHWLGLVAMATGDVAYVDRPLYDYVQHTGATLGRAVGSRPSRRGALRGWRAAYFYGYLPHEVQAEALLARCGAHLSVHKRRTLERFVAAGRSPLPLAWLAARPLRRLAGANETLGTEVELVRGILWRHLIEARTGRRSRPDGASLDATCPPLDASTLGQGRLGRWRARV